MKRIVIITALAMLASAGCKKPVGPKTTETADLPAPTRRVNRLMPAATPTETTATVKPAADTGETETTEAPAPPPTRTYTIRKGDTLWSVAKKIYGDGKRWGEIAAANDIANESKLPVGKVLRIP